MGQHVETAHSMSTTAAAVTQAAIAQRADNGIPTAATHHDEGQELGVGDQELGGRKGGHVHVPVPVLVVPAKRRKVAGLAQRHLGRWHVHDLVGGRLGRTGDEGRARAPAGDGEDGVDGQLVDEDGGGLDVDALVLEGHPQGPPGRGHGDGCVLGVRHGLDHADDGRLHLVAEGCRAKGRWRQRTGQAGEEWGRDRPQ